MEKGKSVVARRWAIDLTDNSTAPSSRDFPDPLGFTRLSQDQDDSTISRQRKEAEVNWKSQKAWEVAQAPFKNLMMMGFMMWMAGSTVHLFSIGITFSALWQPISALQGVGKLFQPYKDTKVDTLVPKLLFIALNLAGLALGVWKLNTLGLLPTHASDWVSSLSPAQILTIKMPFVFWLNRCLRDSFIAFWNYRDNREALGYDGLGETKAAGLPRFHPTRRNMMILG
ncbi:hypothetical protein HHK36_021226 [Tetracentron sinense]|uniref:ER membrane protein complex subunit 4 n=1 Tax=Tetracentron sinense TaxID=13715 RepID=A0A834YTH7_TETSI|nr:hypothetical protein HHK36_021226 [Tetracentron sinense]